MNTEVFDGIVQEMGEVSTRRSFARLVGGVVALGAGLALGGDSLAKGKSRGKAKARSEGRDRDRENVTAQGGGGKRITICYQNQTLTVKKKKLGNYPGYTRGACPMGPKPEPEPQPVACTEWLISGGPNQYDSIRVDDDLMIWQPDRGGHIIVGDFDGKATANAPARFEANLGEVLGVRAWDKGGCRSLSQLWVHCLATGQKRQLFPGDPGNGSCSNLPSTFIDTRITVQL